MRETEREREIKYSTLVRTLEKRKMDKEGKKKRERERERQFINQRRVNKSVTSPSSFLQHIFNKTKGAKKTKHMTAHRAYID